MNFSYPPHTRVMLADSREGVHFLSRRWWHSRYGSWRFSAPVARAGVHRGPAMGVMVRRSLGGLPVAAGSGVVGGL